MSYTVNTDLSVYYWKMVSSILKKIIMFVPNKLIAINNNVNRVISLPETADKPFTYVTKVTGAAAVATYVSGTKPPA